MAIWVALHIVSWSDKGDENLPEWALNKDRNDRSFFRFKDVS